MRRLFRMGALVGIIWACVSPGSAATPKPWTVMVYSDADNSLDWNGRNDLNELEYAGSTDQVNMIWLLDLDGWNDTKLYYVLHDPNGQASGNDMNIVSQDISSSAPWLSAEEDMGNPQTLKDFTTWVIQNYPAEHYLLSIWDHGNGIFDLTRPHRVTRGECWDDHGGVPGEYIDLAELREVLAAMYVANGDRKIDIVGHDACDMGQVELHYQMSPFVSIGIASETSEPGDGWEYGTPFADLITNPLMTPTDLAARIVHDYVARYGNNALSNTQAARDRIGCRMPFRRSTTSRMPST